MTPVQARRSMRRGAESVPLAGYQHRRALDLAGRCRHERRGSVLTDGEHPELRIGFFRKKLRIIPVRDLVGLAGPVVLDARAIGRKRSPAAYLLLPEIGAPHGKETLAGLDSILFPLVNEQD